jgi:hypothetical protein
LDDNTFVEYLGRTQLRYREGSRSLTIGSELQSKAPWIAVDRETIREWEPPHGGAIDPAERDRIFENIRTALERHGYRVEEIT